MSSAVIEIGSASTQSLEENRFETDDMGQSCQKSVSTVSAVATTKANDIMATQSHNDNTTDTATATVKGTCQSPAANSTTSHSTAAVTVSTSSSDIGVQQEEDNDPNQQGSECPEYPKVSTTLDMLRHPKEEEEEEENLGKEEQEAVTVNVAPHHVGRNEDTAYCPSLVSEQEIVGNQKKNVSEFETDGDCHVAKDCSDEPPKDDLRSRHTTNTLAENNQNLGKDHDNVQTIDNGPVVEQNKDEDDDHVSIESLMATSTLPPTPLRRPPQDLPHSSSKASSHSHVSKPQTMHTVLTHQQQALMVESGKLLEHLRKEVYKLRSQNSQLRSDFESLKGNNQRLMDANTSLGSTFDSLNKHAKQVSKTNAKLKSDVQKLKEQLELEREQSKERINSLELMIVELKEELNMKQGTYIEEVHSRLHCQKVMANIVDAVQERCKDHRLVEDILAMSDECGF